MMRRRSLLAALSVAALPDRPAQAQLADRPIRVVVPFPPGGGSDLFARIVAQDLSTRLGRSTVVENRAGAGGNIGVEAVVRATPDGHTILYTTASVAINQSIYRNLPFDVARDLAPLTVVGAHPHILVATAASGIRDLPGLAAAARARPGGMPYASPGNGTSTHLTMEWLRARLGVPLEAVPYRGGAPAANAMLAGEVPVGMFIGAIAKPHIDSGRLVAIATTGEERLAILPDVPTMLELGQVGFVTEQWHATFVPAATPEPVRALLAAAIGAASDMPLMRTRLAEDGARHLNLPPDRAVPFLAAERIKWAEMARLSGATAD